MRRQPRQLLSCAAIAVSLTVVAAGDLSAKMQRPSGRVNAQAPVYLSGPPTPGAQPLRTLPVGAALRILNDVEGWLQVEFHDPQFESRIGWIQKQFVTIAPVSGQTLPIPVSTAAASTDPPAPSAKVTTPSASASVSPPAQVGATVEQRNPPRQTSITSSGTPQAVKHKNVRIRGYVTAVTSPVSFEIEDYRITRADGFSLDFENASPEIQFQLEDIRIGVELEIRGQLNETTGDLRAQSITVDLEQFKSHKVTGIVSARPHGLTHAIDGWSGRFFADGQTIEVLRSTEVVFRPTAREKKQTEKGSPDVPPTQPLVSLDEIEPGMILTYEGKRDRKTGHILADRVEFSRNDLDDGEAKLWKSLKTSVKAAQGFTPGELKIDKVGKFKLLNSEKVQDYVTGIATRLIPMYQSGLPTADPRRIPFQVHVVENDAFNAFATPNGIIVVHTGLIELLENEAQLAAVVGHEVAHSTHEHTWRASQADKKKRIGLQIAGAVAAGFGQYDLANLASMIEGAIRNGYSRGLENQADRVGLQAMIAAGYDPRQAPAVWKLVTKKYGDGPTDFFWSSHENHATRRSYLMNELKNNYRDLDYSSLAVNTEQYAAMKAAMREALSSTKKIKVR